MLQSHSYSTAPLILTHPAKCCCPPAAQLAIGADGLGRQTAVVLQHVVRALARDYSWRPHLPELLQGLDEVRCLGVDCLGQAGVAAGNTHTIVHWRPCCCGATRCSTATRNALTMHSTAPATLQLLDRRDKEAAGTDARSRNDRLRYNARLYRLLGAVLLAATPLMPLPPAVAPPGPGLASTVDQLRRLVQRMAMLVVGSCLAVQREYAAQRAQAAAGRVGLAVLDVEDDLGSALRSLGDVRQRLQVRRGLGWVWGLVWKSAGRLKAGPGLQFAVANWRKDCLFSTSKMCRRCPLAS